MPDEKKDPGSDPEPEKKPDHPRERVDLNKPFWLAFASLQPDEKQRNQSFMSFKEVQACFPKTTQLGDEKLKSLGSRTYCLPNYEIVSKDTTLAEYCDAAQNLYNDKEENRLTKNPPTITIYYRSRTPSTPAKDDAESRIGDLGSLTNPLTNPIDFGKKADNFGKASADQLDSFLRNGIPNNGDSNAIQPANLSVENWGVVIASTGLLNGFSLNDEGTKITKAQKSAFQLSKALLDQKNFAPSRQVQERAERSKKDATAEALRYNFEEPEWDEEVENKENIKVEEGSAAAKTVTMTEGEGEKSTRPAEHLLNAQDSSSGEKLYKHGPQQNDKSNNEGKGKNEETGNTGKVEGKLVLGPVIPYWEVCDDAGIQIKTVKTSLEVSASDSAFNSQNWQASLSGAYKLFSASASGGKSSEHSSSHFSASSSETKQLIASYNFSRVRVYLDKNRIELSVECKERLKVIRERGTYTDVLAFFKDFGAIFATKVRLGGRLRATRTLRSTAEQSEQQQKDAFKWSISASMGLAPFAKANGSYEKSGSNGSSSKESSSNATDGVVWEAQGGNTLLCSNPSSPSAWCPTVERYYYWRVIDQEAVLPMEQAIALVNGYEDIPLIFSTIGSRGSVTARPFEINWSSTFAGKVTPSFGQGFDSRTGKVKEKALTIDLLKAAKVSSSKSTAHDILQSSPPGAGAKEDLDTSSEPPNPAISWTMIDNESSATEYINHLSNSSFPTFANSLYVEPHLQDVIFSNRAFTVILKYEFNLHRDQEPVKWVSKVLEEETDEFLQKFGDYYINSITKGYQVYVVWVFDLPPLQSNQQRKRMFLEIFKNQVSLANGCDLLANLANIIPCRVTWWQDVQSNRLQPNDVLSSLQNLKEPAKKSDVNPNSERVVKVELKPYSVMQPAFKFLVPQPYVPDADHIRILRDAWLQVFLLGVFSRTSPIQDGGRPLTNELIPTGMGTFSADSRKIDFNGLVAGPFAIIVDWARWGPDSLPLLTTPDWFKELVGLKRNENKLLMAPTVKRLDWLFRTLIPGAMKFIHWYNRQWRAIHQLRAWLRQSRIREMAARRKLLNSKGRTVLGKFDPPRSTDMSLISVLRGNEKAKPTSEKDVLDVQDPKLQQRTLIAYELIRKSPPSESPWKLPGTQASESSTLGLYVGKQVKDLSSSGFPEPTNSWLVCRVLLYMGSIQIKEEEYAVGDGDDDDDELDDEADTERKITDESVSTST